MWVTLTMSEIWDEVYRENKSAVFGKPSFPTRRWGKIHTKTATNCITTIRCALHNYTVNGHKVRKRICHETTTKHKGNGKFYKLEIFKDGTEIHNISKL